MRDLSLLIHAGLICAIVLSPVPAAGTEFYVSPTGDDTQAGSEQAPFRTMARVKGEVRKKVAEGLREPVTVLLRSGTYELSETLMFGQQDAGTEQFAIKYVAFPGETVTLSGGRRITNWKVDDQGRWAADLPDVKAGSWFFRQLIVDDQRAIRARWPNEDGVLRISGVTDGVKRFTFNQTLGTENLNGQDAEMVVYENWSVTRGLVTASDAKQLTTATPMGWIGHGDFTTASPGKPVYLEHARAFLDEPGEWFLDRAAGVLHYFPAQDADPAKTVVVAPVLQRLIVIAGTQSEPVRNLRFEGIRFEHADFPLPAIGYNEIQAAHYGTTTKDPTQVHPVAIECTYAEACRFERCRFARPEQLRDRPRSRLPTKRHRRLRNRGYRRQRRDGRVARSGEAEDGGRGEARRRLGRPGRRSHRQRGLQLPHPALRERQHGRHGDLRRLLHRHAYRPQPHPRPPLYGDLCRLPLEHHADLASAVPCRVQPHLRRDEEARRRRRDLHAGMAARHGLARQPHPRSPPKRLRSRRHAQQRVLHRRREQGVRFRGERRLRHVG